MMALIKEVMLSGRRDHYDKKGNYTGYSEDHSSGDSGDAPSLFTSKCYWVCVIVVFMVSMSSLTSLDYGLRIGLSVIIAFIGGFFLWIPVYGIYQLFLLVFGSKN